MIVVKFEAWVNLIILNPLRKPWPIHVPAAAVIHEWRALFVMIGCIRYVGDLIG